MRDEDEMRDAAASGQRRYFWEEEVWRKGMQML